MSKSLENIDIKKEAKKKNKVSDIISIVIGVLLLVISAIAIASKVSGKDIFFFGSRMDVVLTDSMSVVHNEYKEEYKEKGWDNQIQVNDLIVSKKVTDTTELNVGDIVTYTHPAYGKLTHRIYNIYTRYDGEVMYTIKADKTNYNDGNFTREVIVSKCTNNAGQIGAVIRYLQSFWGMIMLIGLAMICFTYSYLIDLPPKEERLKLREEKKQLKLQKKELKANNEKKES